MTELNNKNLEIKENQINPEKSIEKKELNDIPELKYENICERIWENSDFVNEICKKMDKKILAWLEDKWINWIELYKQNNIELV